jgi:hypothetical protein
MLKCKFLDKDRKWHFGEYMFTVDFCQNDPGYLNTGFSETVEEHKSYNFIKLDNGQFAAQPNNKTLFYDASLTVPEFKMPDFKIATKYILLRNTINTLQEITMIFFMTLRKETNELS